MVLQLENRVRRRTGRSLAKSAKNAKNAKNPNGWLPHLVSPSSHYFFLGVLGALGERISFSAGAVQSERVALSERLKYDDGA
jgi:hypothetical protein